MKRGMEHLRMMFTGDNRSTWRKPRPNATFYTNLLWNDLESIPGFRGESLVTDRLSQGTKINVNYI
jgi:hypothetical protein